MRQNNLNLTCLGYSGRNSLCKRIFMHAVIGFIEIIREKHRGTPIAVMSPICTPVLERLETSSSP
ncbi:hypothetical protein [Paenibacillus sp. UNC451MF]|uniref:hypothetical protein n=1 Tax=Paenibacillus sp. UNC451MF TaxID=1449063 RepID=UPI0018CC591E|nr:hypothetical protein [Paenibacillus sp. UNC451MF]